MRSVSADHRQWLQERGIATPDLLIGRTRSSEPAEPAELRELPPGVTEWMTHPGYPDPESGSEYDLARREDLDELLRARVRERFDTPIWGEDVVRGHPPGGVRVPGRTAGGGGERRAGPAGRGCA